MNYTIEVREIESMRVAYLPYKGAIEKANTFFPTVFKSIQGKAAGAPFFCYYWVDQATKEGELEMCVPTEQTPSVKGVGVKEFPSVKAITVTHKGSYATLPLAYTAIENYCKEKGLQLQHPFREVFIKGPGMFTKGNPDNYITEIIFPLKEEE